MHNLVHSCCRFEDMPTISQFITAITDFWGGFFIISGSTFFGGFLYAAVMSKLLPLSNSALIFAIQNDRVMRVANVWVIFSLIQ
ncbi:hypothetical protein L1987_59562 [Smallanthus sonchifolius]|uniref:Uncharacterized protein n=1 Tax=Smallanthus sonchifolius TaxID=185202 RepID=A0ACB9D5M3_9ASTR|nr:hypothetical protein L1987_59562 [Smallanthus sonchifolius]